MPAEIGQPVPQFQLPDQDKNPVSSEQLRGHKSLVVFIPFPFTSTCEGELCMIRDRLADLNDLDANVIAITCDTPFANRRWSEDNRFGFPVLSDFWPHGEIARKFGAFNDKVGAANRYTFVVDDEGTVRDIINTDSLGTAREFQAYVEALSKI